MSLVRQASLDFRPLDTNTKEDDNNIDYIIIYSYTYYDEDELELKTRQTSRGTVVNEFFDTRGQLRWLRDGDGAATYFGYDAAGARTLQVVDVDTTTLPTSVDNDWDGTDYGYGADDTVPFTRSASGTALNLETTWAADDNGRITRVTDPEGMVTHTAYLDGETRVYPAWDAVNDKPLLPVRITKTDHAGRVTETILADTSTGVTFTDPPDGSETIAQSKYVQWSTSEYDVKGLLVGTKRYHSIPTTGDGTLVTDYYETLFQYDSQGDREHQIDIIDDGSGSYEVEQVTKWTRDAWGRVIKVEEGVSSDTHDMDTDYTTYPTLSVVSETYYDDPDSDTTPEQGVGDGNISVSVGRTPSCEMPSV